MEKKSRYFSFKRKSFFLSNKHNNILHSLETLIILILSKNIIIFLFEFFVMTQNYSNGNICINIPRYNCCFRISALTTLRDGGVSRSARSTWAFCSMHDQRRSQVYNNMYKLRLFNFKSNYVIMM